MGTGIYETEDSVARSFDQDFIPEELLQAQWAEFIELKKIITEKFVLKKKRLFILDIGIGNARVPKHLCGIPEIWDMIAAYDGIDNAWPCINISRKVIDDLNIGDRVSVKFLEAHDINSLHKSYDLVITTWFTAGNFFPDNFSFEEYPHSHQRLDLSRNEKFEKVFSAAYQMLSPGGEIVLGSCYIDNDNTRKKQEAFYKKIGMTIITGANDEFTATKERFWSQRFTKEKMLNYFSYVPAQKIIFTPLDTYDYAMSVRIAK
ncbi:MAG TPA: class I SAM-dependent methyltransferase [Chitinophagaceae bacterium]|nr:class I SAM-dependent methyltransferase [Chitinophagaceae bacterium]